MMQLKLVGTFDSVNARQDGITTMRFKFPFSELTSSMRLLMSLGKEMKVLIVNETEEKVPLGMVSIKQLTVDAGGETKLTIVGELPQIDISKVYMLLEQQITFYTKIDEVGGLNDE